MMNLRAVAHQSTQAMFLDLGHDNCVHMFSVRLFAVLLVHMFCLQGQVMGFSIRRRNEIHLCKVFWFPAAAEGEKLLNSSMNI